MRPSASVLDAIRNYLHWPHVTVLPFQPLHLRVNTATRVAELFMTGVKSVDAIIKHEIDWTDFPLDGMTLWLVFDWDIRVMLMPGEC
jgi:hypothetical protein